MAGRGVPWSRFCPITLVGRWCCCCRRWRRSARRRNRSFWWPPYIPYAPGLLINGVDLTRLLLVHSRNEEESLWALEQVLSAGCGAALGWPQALHRTALRRLQLAAERGGGVGFLLCRPRLVRESSPAALRLRVTAAGNKVDILKRRGGWPVEGVALQREREAGSIG